MPHRYVATVSKTADVRTNDRPTNRAHFETCWTFVAVADNRMYYAIPDPATGKTSRGREPATGRILKRQLPAESRENSLARTTANFN